MARQKRELFPKLRDNIKLHRNTILYVIIVAAFFGMLAGWAMMPDQVTIFGKVAGSAASYGPKAQALIMNFCVSVGFGLLLWRFPRELFYLVGAVFGLFVTYGMIPLNLGLI